MIELSDKVKDIVSHMYIDSPVSPKETSGIVLELQGSIQRGFSFANH